MVGWAHSTVCLNQTLDGSHMTKHLLNFKPVVWSKYSAVFVLLVASPYCRQYTGRHSASLKVTQIQMFATHTETFSILLILPTAYQ